jgi:hypothetical protein
MLSPEKRAPETGTWHQLEMRECASYLAALQFLFPQRKDWQRAASLFEGLAHKPQELQRAAFLKVDKEATRAAFVGSEKDVSVGTTSLSWQRFEREELPGCQGVLAWFGPDEQEAFLEMGARMAGEMPPNRRIWAIEWGQTSLSPADKRERKDSLEAWGLVGAKAVQKREGAVWYGRTRKRGERPKIDLTENVWFKRILTQVQDELLAQGWRRVDLSEAIEACRQSRFPPGDLSNLKLGMPAVFESPCGCSWHVDKGGSWERKPQEHCFDPDCEGLPPPPPKKGEAFYAPAFNEGGQRLSCYQCDQGLYSQKVVTEVGKTKALFKSSLFCSRHGARSKPREGGVSKRTLLLTHSRIEPLSSKR